MLTYLSERAGRTAQTRSRAQENAAGEWASDQSAYDCERHCYTGLGILIGFGDILCLLLGMHLAYGMWWTRDLRTSI